MAAATSIQQLLNQLSGFGFENIGDFSQIPNLGQQTIMGVMEDMFNVEGFLDPAMFQTIDPLLTTGALQKTYRPLIESSNQALLGKMYATREGAGAQKAAGNFAGTGGFQKYLQQAKDVYGMGATETFANVGKQKQSSLQAISDIFSDWQMQASEIASPPV